MLYLTLMALHHHEHEHGHGCGHDHHGHDHIGGHHHAPKDFGRAFFLGITLNTVFIIAEVAYGLKANSLALLADAGHNVGDVLALALAWAAAALGRRKPSHRFTYGLGGSSIIVSLANAVVLLIVTGAIAWESVLRLMSPEPAAGLTIIAVAGLGVVINGATALLFMRGQEHDINIRGAYMHMAADAATSLGVVISGAIILKTGWRWLDPAASLIISAVIVFSTLGLLRESLSLSLQGVPRAIDPAAVRRALLAAAGAREVHDLHIWAMSTTEVACSAHLVMPAGHPGDAKLKEIAERLEHDFGINHTTLQIELGDSGMECPLAPDHIV